MFGLLNLHKPAGPTSRDCVNTIQRIVRPHKVGHAGTLDPIASGVLIVLIGNATRLTDEFHRLNKEYVGTFQLGATSPSVDTETEISLVPWTGSTDRENFERTLQTFLGTIQQTPPIYSAIRVDGKRAHELARSGEEVCIPTREVHIEELELLELTSTHFKIRVVCGTGTYIRSLGRDIARSLGTDAIMTDLIRTRIGNQTISQSHSPDSLLDLSSIQQSLQPPQSGLAYLPAFLLPADLMLRFQNGQKIPTDILRDLQLPTDDVEQALAVDENNNLRGIIGQNQELGVWRTLKFFPVSD